MSVDIFALSFVGEYTCVYTAILVVFHTFSLISCRTFSFRDNFRFFDPSLMSSQKFGSPMLGLALPGPEFLALTIL